MQLGTVLARVEDVRIIIGLGILVQAVLLTVFECRHRRGRIQASRRRLLSVSSSQERSISSLLKLAISLLVSALESFGLLVEDLVSLAVDLLVEDVFSLPVELLVDLVDCGLIVLEGLFGFGSVQEKCYLNCLTWPSSWFL